MQTIFKNVFYGPQNNESHTGLESLQLHEKSVHKQYNNVLQMQKYMSMCF